MCIRKLFIVSKSLDADQKPNHLHNSFLMINDHQIWCNLSIIGKLREVFNIEGKF